MTATKTLPCFGGPLDGKRLPYAGFHHECAADVALFTYSRVSFCRPMHLANGQVRLQKAKMFVLDELITVDFKLPPERHDELDWSPTEEEIIREAEERGEI